MNLNLTVSFEKIKQKQYYDADGLPIPESDIINHPHIGHSVDRDNFLRLNFGQDHLNMMYRDGRWRHSDLLHIQGLPIYAKWLKYESESDNGCCHAECNCK